jgi:acyl-CoA synthetase (AMP-forming)/AMP-acid ligase II
MNLVASAALLPESCETLPAALEFWATHRPDSPALVAAGVPTINYGELWTRVRQHAEDLARFGVARDECVILLLPDGPTLATAFLAAASAAIAFALDPVTPGPELERLLPRLRVGAVIAEADIDTATRDVLARQGIPVFAPVLDGAVLELLVAGSPRRSDSWASPAPNGIATIRQTSGTTGKPKLIPREHRRIIASGRRNRDLFKLTTQDRALAVAPMSLSLGKTTLLHTVCTGSSLIFPSSYSPDLIPEAMQRDRPTWMHSGAGFLELLARHLRGQPPNAPSSLRFVRVTAAAISPAVCDELERYLGAPILPAYSTSETGLVATTLPDPDWRKPDSVGRLVQEVRIVDESGREVPPGEDGEVWIRGESVISGYLDDPTLNASAILSDGWFRVGDVGHLDADGFLFLTGRVNELINRGGFKISPSEIDAVLRSHPAVREAATFAVPDERLGQDIVAAVVPEPELTTSARSLRQWMLARLTPHKVPRRIWFLPGAALPRTPSGKVKRSELAHRYLAETPAPIS